MEAASYHLGDSSPRLGGGVFEPTRFVLELSWQSFSMGTGGSPCNVNAYNESRGYRGAEVREESTCFATVALDLLA